MPNLWQMSREDLIEKCISLTKRLTEEKNAHEKLRELYETEKQSAQRRNNMDQILLDVLEGERALVTKLLKTMVPPKIAKDLSNGIIVPPEMHRFCVIFFSDIEGFTSFGDSRPPLEVFDMLDGLFSVMDFCTSAFPALYKVETIGDAYMVVAGILDLSEVDDEVLGEGSQDQQITRCMLEFAILVNQAVQRVDMDESSKVKIRIGLHHGPVVTGLTGNLTPHFCCFGDTVNTASRMETTGATTKIHISKSFVNFIQDAPYAQQYSIVPRESLTPIKGKGLMETFFLEPSPSRDILLQYSEELEHVDNLVSNAAAVRGQRRWTTSFAESAGSTGSEAASTSTTTTNTTGILSREHTGIDIDVGASPRRYDRSAFETVAAGAKAEEKAEETRFCAFNMRTAAPAAVVLSNNDFPPIMHDSDARSEAGSRGERRSLRSESRMSSVSGYSGFSGAKLSSLTHTNFQPSIQNTEAGNNSKSSTESDEFALLLRRCAALETKYNEAVTAKALADDDRQAALELMRDNAAKAAALREKNAKLAFELKEKHERKAAELVQKVIEEVARTKDPAVAKQIKFQADIAAAELRRTHEERAAELYARNVGKANLLAAKNAAIAAALAKEQVDAAVSLEIDQSILATDLKMLEDEELANPPTSSSDEEAKQGDGEDEDKAVVVDLLAANVNIGNHSRTSSGRSIKSGKSSKSENKASDCGSGSASASKNSKKSNGVDGADNVSGSCSGSGTGTGTGTGSGAGSGSGGGAGTGTGSGSSRSSISTRRAARLAGIAKSFNDKKLDAQKTALIVAMARRQDSADKMREEEEEEERATLEETEGPSPGKITALRSASFRSSGLASLLSSSPSSSSVSGLSKSGSNGSLASSAATTSAISTSTSSTNASAASQKRRADELQAGILPFTLAEYMSPSFDVLSISHAQPLAITRAIFLHIEGICGDMTRMDVPYDVWTRFLWSSGAFYSDASYHNFHHAFCVVQYTAILLRDTGGIDKLTPKELFVALLTAVVHDVDHRGLNNAFHVNSKSQLAQKYSNSSVLENHHLEVCFGIMKEASKNPLARWTQEEQIWFREEMTRMVIKTDMSFHNDLTRMLEQRSKQTQPFDLSLKEDRAVYLEVILHAADIANSVRPFAQSEVLATRLALEFNLQAEKEQALGLPVSVPLQQTIMDVCKGEQGFLNYVAKPYWQAMHGCFPALEVQLLELENNVISWQRLAESVAGSPFADEPITDRLQRLPQVTHAADP